ncbi:hypothetical protein [Sphingobium yanoikuyae]|uniref:hypothetical protein n=1 Tax=Sphingobium yanoikuyae TaxID=13690 RepID=UPI0030C866AD
MPSIETSWPLAEPVAAQTARPVPIVTRPLAIRRHFLAALGGSMLLLALLLDMADLRIDFWQPSSIAYGAAAALLLALRFGLPRSGWRHAGTVAPFATYVGLFTLISVMGAAASYPVAALSGSRAASPMARRRRCCWRCASACRAAAGVMPGRWRHLPPMSACSR